MTDTSYAVFRESIGAVWLQRDVVRAQGPDVVSFLHGQLSQDIERIEVGTSAWSWILQPHGKVDALVRLTRPDEETFIIDTDGRFGEALLERLNRFKMRTKVEFELLEWKALALRGPQSHEVAAASSQDFAGKNGVVATANWPGCTGVDLLGVDFAVPDDVPVLDKELYEALRIECGVPEMGSEIDERTIPAEAGINDMTISFNKGCYTGQELVARIDSRGGNVPRRLNGVIVESSIAPLLGSQIMPLGRITTATKPIGYITSASYSPHFEKAVALAYIRRDMVVPGKAVVVSDGESFECHVQKLPLVS